LLVGFDGACNSFALMLLLLVLRGYRAVRRGGQVAGAGTPYQHGNKVSTLLFYKIMEAKRYKPKGWQLNQLTYQ
jgi:hypothetical protein